jgi:hypothetical protein
MYESVTLSVVLFGCEAYPLTLREPHSWFANRLRKRIFVFKSRYLAAIQNAAR